MRLGKQSVADWSERTIRERTFVLHVRNGYEERGEHIDKMMRKMNIDFEYILDGDMDDLTNDTLEQLFSGETMKGRFPQTSCAMKHLLAYREIVGRGLDGAIILEDDIFLHDKFNIVFNKSMKEMAANPEMSARPVIISYEDTRLRFVPRSQRRPGTVLYPGDRDRMAGAYYINLSGAKLIIEYVRRNRMDVPIDILHNKLLKTGALTYLWCHPTVATQGSHNGSHKSAINLTKGMFAPTLWLMQRAYKKILYFFR